MQGAIIEEVNTTAFGNISFPNGSGFYEIATVCDVTGTTICFQYELVNTYFPISAANMEMQLISIPRYVGNVNVAGTLTGDPWDGDVGGVLIFEATGTVTLNANIDMSGMGFRGGLHEGAGWNNCNFFTPDRDLYYYDINQANGTRGGWKGEGISKYIATKEAGRGPQANGGGGGNDHNTGGGGGSNYSRGGLGGDQTTTFCDGSYGGEPGRSLDTEGYSLIENQVFLGGGGGSGHANNNEGTAGGNGGGIVIIIADELDGNGNAILANGNDAADSGADGAGGGGAGGAVLLNVNTYAANPLTIEANGGDGGNSSTIGNDCMGPGGGGGGGAIWAAGALGGTVTTDVTAGQAGLVQISAASPPVCNGTQNGAFAGLAGAVLTNLDIPEETINNSPCVLAAEILTFSATPEEAGVVLNWEVNDVQEFQQFVVERSVLGIDFETLASIPADAGEKDYSNQFVWPDLEPVNGNAYYRLRMTDRYGSVSYSHRIEINFQYNDLAFQNESVP